MKKVFYTMAFAIILVFEFFSITSASLLVRGLDDLGNQLIYDTDLNITWYDYSNTFVNNSWYDQMSWADNLEINYNGTILENWRLPTATVFSNGSAAAGYDITESEFGHLYYTELGNSAGNLINTGDFTGIRWDWWHWSSQVPNSVQAFDFYMQDGYVGYTTRTFSNAAIAVMDGDVAAPVPIPSSILLFGTSIAGIAVSRIRKIKK